ncbi:hypothetical protein [Deinococcus enclensis]|uniref:Lipoprotein n=1 Tax=Deinococcus enclensis TaxID=1049582 RepID=A0ABT9MG27_9DEIO|nr:hypothetical protein [Deinococcus enclensis]MDP9765505.1 hypothetical protein [Deinococcus enclensis]
MKRSPYRKRAALLLTALLGQGAAASCDDPALLLDVTVLGSARGGHLVYLRQDGEGLSALLPAGVLRSAEAPLIAGTLTCDGEPYVALTPDVRLRFSETEQAITVTAAPARLGSRVADFQGFTPGPAALPGEPGVAVAFGAQAALRDLQTWNGWTSAAYLDVAGAWGTVAGTAGLTLLQGGETLSVQPRATLQYTPGPDVTWFAVWNAQPGGAPGFGVSEFRGVAVAGRHLPARVLPDVTLELPQTTTVEVRVGDQALRTFEADPGTLTLRHIPLPPEATTLTVILTDELGTRELQERIPASSSALPPGAVLYSAQAGWTAGRLGAEGTAEFGLPDAWTLLTAASAGETGYGLRARATRTTPGTVLALHAGISGQYGARPTPELGLSAARTLGPWTVQGQLLAPLTDLQDASLNVGARYVAPGWVTTLDASTRLQPGTWQVSGAVTRTFDAQGSVTLAGSADARGYRAALRGTWQLDPRWQVGAGVTHERPGAVALNPTLDVRYTPAPEHTLELSASRDLVNLHYDHTGQVLASADAGTGGVAAQVQGAVVISGGVTSLQPGAVTRGVLVKTGLPGLRLYVDGQYAGTTDARGTLLLGRLPLGRTVTVSVDVAELPFSVALQEAFTRLTPPVTGILTLDWTGNFRTYRWVQYFWRAGTPAAYGKVVIGDDTVLLDDEGNGLTPDHPGVRQGTLQDEDGQTCALVLAPTSDTATCAPQ